MRGRKERAEGDAISDRSFTPWPGDAVRVQRWLRANMRSLGLPVEGIDRIRVHVELAGDDITDLVIDATDVDLRIPADARTVQEQPAQAEELRPVTASAGIARSLRLIAGPARIHGYPVAVDAQLHDAPIRWLTYAEPARPGRPESAVALDLGEEGLAGASGALDLRMREADLGPMLQALLGAAPGMAGVRLRSLDVDVSTRGERVSISGSAAIRWKIFGASARGRAQLSVSPRGLITVGRLQIGSRNPFIAIALRVSDLREQLRSSEGTTLDLNEELGANPGDPLIHDLRVEADGDLRITARLG